MKKRLLFPLLFLAITFAMNAQDRILADFESEVTTAAFDKMNMVSAEIVNNPDKSGVNTSNKVLKVEKAKSGDGWFFVHFDISPELNFATHPVLSVKIHSPNAVNFNARIDNDIKWEMQFFTNEYANNGPTWSVLEADKNKWVEFSVDLGRFPAARYNSLDIGIALSDTNAGTYYIDDLKLIERAPAVTAETMVPILYDALGSFRWVGDWANGAATNFSYWYSNFWTRLNTDTLSIGNGWNWDAAIDNDLPSDTIPGASSGPFFKFENGKRNAGLTLADIDIVGCDSMAIVFDMAWGGVADVTGLAPSVKMKIDNGSWTSVGPFDNMPVSDTAWTTVSASMGKVNGQKLSVRIEDTTANEAILFVDDIKIYSNLQAFVSGITIVVPKDTMPRGATLDLSSVVEPANSRQRIAWSVINGTGKATISTMGVLTADTIRGTVIVKATALDGSGVVSEKLIMIDTLFVALTKIEITAPDDSIKTNRGTLQMSIGTWEPAYASKKQVTWSVDNVALATINANTGLLRGAEGAKGIVKVIAVATDGSEVSDTMAITIVGPSDINKEVTRDQFVIYPNPANNVLNIDNVTEITTIAIYNILGSKVMEINNSNDKITLSTAALSRGVYILYLTGRDGVIYTNRFQKQ